MTKHRPLSLILGIVLATASGVAQSASAITMPWPGASFEQAVVGDFQGSLRRSVVVARGGLLHYVFEPGRYQSFVPIAGSPSGVTGMVTFPQAGVGPGARDMLLVTTSTATYRAVYNSSTHLFVFTAELNSSWNGARNLVARAEPVNTVRIAGIHANGTTVLLAQRDATGTISQTAQATVATAIHEIEWLDWDHNGTLEAVVTDHAAVTAFTPTGAQVTQCAMTMTLANTVPVVDGGADQLGIVTAYQGNPLINFMLPCLSTTSLPIPSNGLSPTGRILTGLAAYDISGGGRSSMLLTQRGWFKVLVVAPPANAQDPGTQRIVDILPGAIGSPELNLCPPIWEDLDTDGIPDGLFFWNSVGGTDPAMVLMPMLDGIDHPPPHQWAGWPNPAFHAGLIASAVYQFPDLTLTLSPSQWASANKVTVVAWHQTDPSGTPPPLESMSVAQTNQLFTPGQSVTVTLTLRPLDATSPGTWPSKDHYYLDIRLIDTVANKVAYAEIDGIVMPYHQGSLLYTQYLAGLPATPGREQGSLSVTVQVPQPPPGVPPGGIITNVVPPPFAPGAPVDG
ncbi:MAG TPA: hypothetical protein VK348_11555 [Planctomycetota bacterium]|nr:hypothetical protein [Planctomycetota bacterium]